MKKKEIARLKDIETELRELVNILIEHLNEFGSESIDEYKNMLGKIK